MIFAATQLDDAWLINLELGKTSGASSRAAGAGRSSPRKASIRRSRRRACPLIGTATRCVGFISTTTLDRLAHRKQSGAPPRALLSRAASWDRGGRLIISRWSNGGCSASLDRLSHYQLRSARAATILDYITGTAVLEFGPAETLSPAGTMSQARSSWTSR
jgi:hypothetical protein